MSLVSICCITYNHENFIRDAIDSFLQQKVDFDIEIIIHDDASADDTPTIIREYHDQAPGLIKPILQSENQFSKYGFSFLSKLFEKAQGKYIAICEGDDYWTDPLKLQKQVDFLESNPDFSICFHKVLLLDDDELKQDNITQVPSRISTIIDLARQGNYVHTPSCMFRNYGPQIFGSHFSESPVGDYYIHMMNAQFGKIYCLDDVMAVYRLHINSAWSSKDQVYREIKFQKTRLAVLQDLLPTSSEAIRVLSEAYLKQALALYSKTRDDSIKEEVRQLFSASQNLLIEISFQKQIELDKAQSEIIALKKQQFFRRIIKFFKSKLGYLRQNN